MIEELINQIEHPFIFLLACIVLIILVTEEIEAHDKKKGIKK